MNFDNQFQGANALSNTINSTLSAVGRVGSQLAGGSQPTYWKDRLRPAQFRGVKFTVLDGQVQFGRRASIHEYPFRDGVWVEDLGGLARKIGVKGFLTGDDCIEQRNRLMAVCSEAAAVEGADLVHPTLGRLTVALIEPVTASERWDQGRYFEVSFVFIEQGKRRYPTSVIATAGQVSQAATAAQAANQTTFAQKLGAAIQAGTAKMQQIVNTAQHWTRTAQRWTNDATNMVHLVQSLNGEFGRFIGQQGVRSALTSGQLPVTTQTVMVRGAQSRANVVRTSAQLMDSVSAIADVAAKKVSADGINPVLSTCVLAANDLITALTTAAPSAASAIRLLTELLLIEPALGQSVHLAEMLRRITLIQLANVVQTYQPSCYDDASQLQKKISRLLDAEIELAGNQGDDAIYQVLRDLRAAVVMDLHARGGNLARLVSIKTQLPMPALVMAHRLYQPEKTDQITAMVAQANPIHPAFMPTTFQTLGRV